jgi:hypothetical protein
MNVPVEYTIVLSVWLSSIYLDSRLDHLYDTVID